MKTKKRTTKKVWLSLLLAVVLVCIIPVSVMADTTDETNATVTFTEGVLEIVTVPDLTFTSTALSPGAYSIALSSANNDVAVSDLRGTHGDWKLTVALGNFTLDGGDGSSSLGASSIQVVGASPTGPTNEAGKTATCGGTITATCADTPTAVTVMQAESEAGYGTWAASWTSATTTLEIPESVSSVDTGTHVADMHWDLVDGL